jgi:hypothetical protein
MLVKLLARLSYANVASTLALFLALGGVSYAAVKLPANSVGSKQLRRNAVTGAKIKNRAVTSSKIGANAVTGFNVDEATLGAVPEATHAASADSAKSATSAGSAGSAPVSRLDYEAVTVPVPAGASEPVTATATCPAGLYATGGGARVGNSNDAYLNDAGPSGRNAWYGAAWPYSGPGSTLTVTVICAPAASVTP